LKSLALPRGTRIFNAINILEKGLDKKRCIQFQWVSRTPPKPFFNTGTTATDLTSPAAADRARAVAHGEALA
jgi:hypothetical protein